MICYNIRNMSSKTVAEKLYMKSGKKVAFFNEPGNNKELLGGIPNDVEVVSRSADILLAYIENEEQFINNLTSLKNIIKPDGAFWIAYHKGTSEVKTDINRDSIVKYASENGLKGLAMISINENWSALRLKII